MSFTLGKGDIFGLLGSNGSGKTTAIKSICGLCPFKGDIRLFGVSVADDPRAALGRIGCIVEAPSFYGNLSAERNLLLAAAHYRMPKREALDATAWALETVGLGKFRRERAERFSLGMKARLGLALCFVSKPDFLALDEPLNGLDIEGMVEIRNLILDLASRTGATFLISSHLAAEVEKTCNRVGVMDEGVLLECASMDVALRGHGSVEAYYLDTLRRRGGQGEGDAAAMAGKRMGEAAAMAGEGEGEAAARVCEVEGEAIAMAGEAGTAGEAGATGTDGFAMGGTEAPVETGGSGSAGGKEGA